MVTYNNNSEVQSAFSLVNPWCGCLLTKLKELTTDLSFFQDPHKNGIFCCSVFDIQDSQTVLPSPGVQWVTTALRVWTLRSAVQTAHTRTRRRSRCAKCVQQATSVTTPWALWYWTTPPPFVLWAVTVQPAPAMPTSSCVPSAPSATSLVRGVVVL